MATKKKPHFVIAPFALVKPEQEEDPEAPDSFNEHQRILKLPPGVSFDSLVCHATTDGQD